MKSQTTKEVWTVWGPKESLYKIQAYARPHGPTVHSDINSRGGIQDQWGETKEEACERYGADPAKWALLTLEGPRGLVNEILAEAGF